MGCGASAPRDGEAAAVNAGEASMEMYFQELQKFTTEEMNDLTELQKVRGAKDAKAVAKMQMDMKAKRGAFKVIADRLLKEIFELGDVSGDGFLNKEESAKLFATIVDEKGEYIVIMAKEEQRRILAAELGMSKKMFEKFDVEDEEAIKKQLEEDSKAEAKRSSEQIDKSMQAAIVTYKAQKIARDKAAFAVLDKSSDGRVNKKEFMAAFDTTSETYEELLTALGLFEAPN